MMRQREQGKRRVWGAVAVARIADGRAVFQRRAVVVTAVGLAIEALVLAARYLGQ